MDEIIALFWFFLPAGIANMAPVLFRRIPILNIPLDFNRTFRGEPIVGSHKTYRGLVVGTFAAVAVVAIQTRLYPAFPHNALMNYSAVNIWTLGVLLGAGALLGDAIKSFFKRRVHIPAGAPWIPFDQIDWIAGALIASAPIVSQSPLSVVAALTVFGALHPLINLLGYLLGIKPNKF